MGYLPTCAVAAVTTMLVSGYFGPSGNASGGPSVHTQQTGAPAPARNTVVRDRKGPLLAPRRAADEQAQVITEIDVVGLHGAAIIFRDASGRVLFRTDRVTNTTTVSKGAILPEVTVRSTQVEHTKRLPVEVPRPLAPEGKLPEYCEPAFSPVAAPTLSQVPGRCVAGLERTPNLAML